MQGDPVQGICLRLRLCQSPRATAATSSARPTAARVPGLTLSAALSLVVRAPSLGPGGLTGRLPCASWRTRAFPRRKGNPTSI